MSKKILIITPSWIGDCVMTQPLYRRLHELNPDMHDSAFRPTQDGQQLANNIVILGAGLALLFSSKKK